jgi:hypothetical protein
MEKGRTKWLPRDEIKCRPKVEEKGELPRDGRDAGSGAGKSG